MKPRSHRQPLRWLPLLLAAAGCGERTVDAVVFTPRCRDILAANPAAPDGDYLLDLDGPGAMAPRTFHCDMKGGGWTRVSLFDFTSPPTQFSRNETSSCGSFGTLLGGHQTFGTTDLITLELALGGVPHDQLRVRYDLIVLDSWDGEDAFLRIDDQEAFRVRCEKSNPASCNQRVDECGWDGLERLDGVVTVDVTVAHRRDVARLVFGAMLDQSRGDESWGIDNLAVLVR